MIAFIGPNGAGKSTSIKMMTGILFPDGGKIDVLGFDPTKERRKLQAGSRAQTGDEIRRADRIS